MDQTIRAIDAKVSVGQILDQVVGAIRGDSRGRGMRSGSRRVVETMWDNPVPIALMGAGLTWLLIEERRGSDHRDHDVEERDLRGEVGERGHAAADKARGAADTMRGKLQVAGDKASGVVSELKDDVSGAAHKAKDAGAAVGHKARDLGGQTVDRVTDFGRGLRHQLDENPMAVGALAFAFGLIGGLALPTTQGEERLVGERGERLKERLGEVGHEALEKGERIAAETISAMRESARDQGLTAGSQDRS